MPLSRAAIAAALTVASLSVFLLSGCSSSGAAANAIGVNALTADPGAYSGEVAVMGVVQNVDPANSTLWLIDKAEYESCGLTPCGSAGLLPLVVPAEGTPSISGSFYEGEIPSIEHTVVVVGSVKSSAEGMYFDVDRIERNNKTILERK